MKPTFRPVVYAHHKRKDGTYNVKIVVYLNGKERKLPTSIYCTKDDLTRTHHIKSQDIINKCNVLILRMHDAISDISIFEDRDVDWLVARIKAKMTAEDFRLDFFAFAEQFIAQKSEGTAMTYVTAVNAFKRFLKRDTLDINDITKKMLVEFVEFVDKEPWMCINRHTGELHESKKKKKKRKGRAANTYIGKLGAIFKEAKKKHNDEDEGIVVIPRSPFESIEVVPPPHKGQNAISKDVLQMIIAAETSNKFHRYALDALVVSFGLMGINMADLYEARPPKEGVMVYRRCKTKERRPDGAEMRVQVSAELQPYLERLGAGTSKDVWLPELREASPIRRCVTTRVNRGLKSWCEKNGVERFTTYGVRKAWATLARSTGADKSLVDECIGHVGDFKMTDIYAERPWEKMAELNRKVLDMFVWNKERED
jgi:site-specific recombinase XerD